MRRHGINYDTGFDPMGDGSTRGSFDPASVRADMRTIAQDLHCDSVRISGDRPERLSAAAEAAAATGLDVWFAPFPCGLGPTALEKHLAECAERAEAVRAAHDVEVVLVAGCEISLFNEGHLPGEDLMERIQALGAMAASGDASGFATLLEGLNTTLHRVAAGARRRFRGPLSYASGPWEHLDWGPFDLVGVDAYRVNGDTGSFRADLRARLRHGKPVVATEFGCCTYRGAGDRGGMGWAVLGEAADGTLRVTEPLVRDEEEQVRHFEELLTVMEEEGLAGAFWFTYAGWELPHRAGDPERDLDLASYGAQAVLADGSLRRKPVFDAIAARYART